MSPHSSLQSSGSKENEAYCPQGLQLARSTYRCDKLCERLFDLPETPRKHPVHYHTPPSWSVNRHLRRLTHRLLAMYPPRTSIRSTDNDRFVFKMGWSWVGAIQDLWSYRQQRVTELDLSIWHSKTSSIWQWANLCQFTHNEICSIPGDSESLNNPLSPTRERSHWSISQTIKSSVQRDKLIMEFTIWRFPTTSSLLI